MPDHGHSLHPSHSPLAYKRQVLMKKVYVAPHRASSQLEKSYQAGYMTVLRGKGIQGCTSSIRTSTGFLKTQGLSYTARPK